MEGGAIDEQMLVDGLSHWRDRCDIVLVEGAGGLMSPVSDNLYNADLALEFGYPVVVVTRNALGTINHTLQTLITAATFCDGLAVAGVVLNEVNIDANDSSRTTNAAELAERCVPPLLAHVAHGNAEFSEQVDWHRLTDTLIGK